MKIVLLVVLLVLAWVGLRSLEPRTLYYPDRRMDATPKAYGLAYEDLWFTTEDGTKINAWYIPGAKTVKRNNPVVLFAHGNAGNISHRLDKVNVFYELGVDVLLFDYRGYGQSLGKPSEKGTYEDALAAYQYLLETRKLPAEKIILYGESLGCAVALETAVRHPAATLILESPFTSTVAMGKLVFPWLPVKWIVKFHYDNLSKIPSIKLPVLFLHSPQDEIVPFAMGKALFAAAPEPKTFVELQGGHNDGYEISGPLYESSLREFLKKNLTKKS